MGLLRMKSVCHEVFPQVPPRQRQASQYRRSQSSCRRSAVSVTSTWTLQASIRPVSTYPCWLHEWRFEIRDNVAVSRSKEQLLNRRHIPRSAVLRHRRPRPGEEASPGDGEIYYFRSVTRPLSTHPFRDGAYRVNSTRNVLGSMFSGKRKFIMRPRSQR